MKAVLLIVSLFLLLIALGAEQATTVKWSANDITGAAVNVPTDRTSLIAFIRPDQEQSKQALKQLKATITEPKVVQVVIVVSGPVDAQRVVEFARELPKEWLAVADPEFAAAGNLNTHVWPTTLVVRSDGSLVAHIGGLPKSFAIHLQAYLDFAAGKLDEAGLKQKLTSNDIVTDGPEQIATRHLQVAQRMIEQSNFEQARAELNEGLKIAPQQPMLQLSLCVHVLLNEPKQAIEILDKLPVGSVPAWQVALVRGRALISLEKWADAKSILPDALKLNPDPAEAYYLLGRCLEHEKDWEHAAEHYRRAFEKEREWREAGDLPHLTIGMAPLARQIADQPLV